MTNRKWATKLPVRGCDCCIDGYITRSDYVAIKCPKCKGKGTLPLERWKDVNVITSQIIKEQNNDS